MTKHHILFLVLVSGILSACSSAENRKRASGDFLYLDSGDGTQINIPEQLNKPTINSRYAIPNLEDSSENPLLGRNLSIVSPRLVIPLVAGSHIEEGDQRARVLFDQINDNESLTKTIWDAVLAYLELNQIGVERFDREANVLITQKVTEKKEVDSSWYDFTSEYTETSKQFKITLDVAPHGRTVALTNEMIDFVGVDGRTAMTTKNVQQKREDEVGFLNAIIAEYDFGLRLERNQRIALIKDGFSSDLGFNAVGEPAIVVDAVYGNAWPRIQLVLKKMNFDVVDLDQSSGLLFVKYTGEDEGWFSGLFAGGESLLDEGEYRLQVAQAGQQTSLTFKDAESNTFLPGQVAKIFPLFNDLMSSDNLDL